MIALARDTKTMPEAFLPSTTIDWDVDQSFPGPVSQPIAGTSRHVWSLQILFHKARIRDVDLIDVSGYTLDDIIQSIIQRQRGVGN